MCVCASDLFLVVCIGIVSICLYLYASFTHFNAYFIRFTNKTHSMYFAKIPNCEASITKGKKENAPANEATRDQQEGGTTLKRQKKILF